ncbi:MAG: response regulator [SAR324 cluster bacterium]|nr:response regulator [SAR324 cluster bacterium]
MENELNLKILAIDDDQAIRKAISAFLDDRGCTVVQAENGRIGLDLFRKEHPDLVLIDLRMPEMNGFEVLSIMADESPETPIIVVSGVGVIQEAIEAIRAGAWDFVTKPIQDMSILLHIVEKTWSHALLQRQNREYRENLEKKSAELEQSLHRLQKTQDKLIAQEKLASLGTLTAGIAHEIKNPLNFVINFAEESIKQVNNLRYKTQNPKGKEIGHFLKETIDGLESSMFKIREHGLRADNIVESMLLHSRSRGGDWRATDINKLLEEYFKLAYLSLRAKDPSFNVDVHMDFDSSLQAFPVDPQELSRVFLNVLNNAFYAVCEKQGNIERFLPVIKIVTRDLGYQAEIRIWDNGSGIAQSHISHLFEPFFTTKPAGFGTGLGLSLCYEIVVKVHQGSIEVESEEGNFTEFVIKIPKKP